MEGILEDLRSILSNAKKKLTQPYSKSTVEDKIKEIEDLETKYKEYLETTTENKENLSAKFTELKEEAIKTLKIHIDKREKKTAVIMTSLDLNELSAISKFIPVFNGSRDSLHNFIANLELVHGTIASEKMQSFFAFIFNTRLELKVQNRLKQGTAPTTIQELITSLKLNYGPTKSANNLLTKVRRRKHVGPKNPIVWDRPSEVQREKTYKEKMAFVTRMWSILGISGIPTEEDVNGASIEKEAVAGIRKFCDF